jgi:hypothetical protein
VVEARRQISGGDRNRRYHSCPSVSFRSRYLHGTTEVDAIELAPNGTSLDLLQQVYRNPSLPLPTRMRAAGMALQFEHPKLAVAVTVNSGDFATQLDKAVERSRMVLMIEAKANVSDNANVSSDTRSPHVQVSNGGKPMIPDRRFRR